MMTSTSDRNAQTITRLKAALVGLRHTPPPVRKPAPRVFTIEAPLPAQVWDSSKTEKLILGTLEYLSRFAHSPIRTRVIADFTCLTPETCMRYLKILQRRRLVRYVESHYGRGWKVTPKGHAA